MSSLPAGVLQSWSNSAIKESVAVRTTSYVSILRLAISSAKSEGNQKHPSRLVRYIRHKLSKC